MAANACFVYAAKSNDNLGAYDTLMRINTSFHLGTVEIRNVFEGNLAKTFRLNMCCFIC